MKMLKECSVLLLAALCCCNGAVILGVFPSPGYSQYLVGSYLMKTLASRGHHVVVISPFKQDNVVNRYEEIVVDGVAELYAGMNLFELDTTSYYTQSTTFHSLGLKHTEMILNNSNVQNLLQSNTHFDLVICEQFSNEAHMAFAHHFKAPFVLLSNSASLDWISNLVGNPFSLAVNPTSFSGLSDTMSFKQRLRNTIFGIFDNVYRRWVVYPAQNKLMTRYFPNAPRLSELLYNTSLVLLNSNIGATPVLSLLPNVIDIGGFHITNKALPKDLKAFLDGARNGVVYFSMGTNLDGVNVSERVTKGVLECFAKLNQNVLWKWKDVPNVPMNVKIGNWIPQVDVLAHPNIRLFITQGGLFSIIEAVHHGIPIIGIPVFGDQKMNVAVAVSKGYALKISFRNLTEHTLCSAINEMLTNTSYRTDVHKRSIAMKDQPMKPLDKAIFWIEYVIRNRGAPYLRSSSLNINWFQYYLFDVILCIILIACVSVLMTILVLKLLFAKKRGRKRTKTE